VRVYLSTSCWLSCDDENSGCIVILIREHPVLNGIEEDFDWRIDVRVHRECMMDHHKGGGINSFTTETGEGIEGIKPLFLRMVRCPPVL